MYIYIHVCMLRANSEFPQFLGFNATVYLNFERVTTGVSMLESRIEVILGSAVYLLNPKIS